MTPDPEGGGRPACTVVTGPTRQEKYIWLEQKLRAIRAGRPSDRCVVFSGDLIPAELKKLASEPNVVAVRRVFVPCACCPALANLPEDVRAGVAAVAPQWVFIELPVLATQGLLAEFDAALHWPRQLVVCLDQRWSEARRKDEIAWFQSQLLAAADLVVEPGSIPSVS